MGWQGVLPSTTGRRITSRDAGDRHCQHRGQRCRHDVYNDGDGAYDSNECFMMMRNVMLLCALMIITSSTVNLGVIIVTAIIMMLTVVLAYYDEHNDMTRR